MPRQRKSSTIRTTQFNYISRKKGWTDDFVKHPPTYSERCEVAWLVGKREPVELGWDE